jgi:hypothetical protein
MTRARASGGGVVPEAGTVELVEEELFDVFRCESRQHDGGGDAGADLLVDGEAQGLHELGLADEGMVV